MKTSILGLLAVIACLAGCATSREQVDAPAKATADIEYKIEVFSDAEMKLTERFAQWERDGWNVHWVSPPLVQPDGTVLREASVSRKKTL